jgi:hypothetical protein
MPHLPQNHGAHTPLEATEKGGDEAHPLVRRRYSSPNLRYLGSVRQLTLGSVTGQTPDGGRTVRP